MSSEIQELPLGNRVARNFPLVIQWLRLRASTARGVGSIPSWGTAEILHATKKKETVVQISSGDRPPKQ